VSAMEGAPQHQVGWIVEGADMVLRVLVCVYARDEISRCRDRLTPHHTRSSSRNGRSRGRVPGRCWCACEPLARAARTYNSAGRHHITLHLEYFRARARCPSIHAAPSFPYASPAPALSPRIWPSASHDKLVPAGADFPPAFPRRCVSLLIATPIICFYLPYGPRDHQGAIRGTHNSVRYPGP
jgi:hypothetical protein